MILWGFMITVLKYGITNTYLLNKRVLIDCDWTGTLPAFFKTANIEGVDYKDIEYLLITHFHPDHMGIAQELYELGIRIVVFDVQKDFIHFSDEMSFKKNKQFKPIKDSDVLFVDIDKSRDFLKKNGIDGEVMHTPGHSDDSISVLLDSGTVIVGDLPPYPHVDSFGDPVITNSWNILIEHGARHACHAHWPEYDI